MWPKARTYGLFEHVVAFAVFGALFSLAYPRRIVFVCVVVFVTAVGLEYLQTFTPDRHGTLFDASEKVVGGAFGIVAAQAFLYLRGWNRKHAPDSALNIRLAFFLFLIVHKAEPALNSN